MADVIKSDLRGTRCDKFGIGGIDLAADTDSLSIPDGKWWGDGMGTLGEMYAIGPVTGDFDFQFATNGTRQSVVLSDDASYHIASQNMPGNGLHQMVLHNASGATITPTWSERFDFGSLGPPTIPDGVICVINGLWDAVGVALHCVHNCPAPITRVVQFDLALGAGVSLTSGSVQRIYPALAYGLEVTAWAARTQDVSGSIAFDVRCRTDDVTPTSSDSICGASHKPYLSAEISRAETDVSNWTRTTIAAGESIAINVDYSSIVSLRGAVLLIYGLQQ